MVRFDQLQNQTHKSEMMEKFNRNHYNKLQIKDEKETKKRRFKKMAI